MAPFGYDENAGIDSDSSTGGSFSTWQSWAGTAVEPPPLPHAPPLVLAPVAVPVAAEPTAEWGTMSRIPRLGNWAGGDWRLATVGERFGAALIDIFVMLVVEVVLAAASLPFEVVPGVSNGRLISIVYMCACNAYGRSFGKAALGIEIVNRDWERPGVIAGIVRWFISNVSALVLLLGYFNVFWDRERRTWHDHAAGTWVVCRRWGITSQPPVGPAGVPREGGT